MAGQSALVVLVPDAERLVGPYRDRFDPSAAAGMPAHVTVLFPFIPPEQINRSARETLSKAASAVAPFEVTFPRTGTFPGVLYLDPEPPSPLQALTEALVAAFPGFPPYEGRHHAIIPHLTVALLEDRSALEAVRSEVEGTLADGRVPRELATAVALMDNASGRWSCRAICPFEANGGRAHHEPVTCL